MEESQFNIEFLGETLNGVYVKDRTTALRITEKLLNSSEYFGFDIETMANIGFDNVLEVLVDPLRSKPRLAQFYAGKNVVVFDLMHIGSTDFLNRLFTQKKLIAHNALFEIQHLLHNFKVKEFDVGCTFLAAKLIGHAKVPDDSGISYSLGSITKQVLKTEIWKDIDHAFWGEPDLNFEQIQYASYDAIATYKVAEKLSVGLKKLGMTAIYRLYKEAQYPIALMQLNGMKIDVEKHLDLISKWKMDAWNARKELEKITGLTVLTSTTMGKYLEETLPPEILAIWPKTESGKSLSVDSNTFSEFDFIEVVEPFSKFQKATTLCSTFGTSLQQKLSVIDNKFHTSFKLGGARTGRLSSSKPNLQNAPRLPEFRSIFIADEGCSLIVADFNQIELRVAAELSGDEEMNRAYRGGLDLHAITAEGITRKKLSDMDEEERAKARQNAKACFSGDTEVLTEKGWIPFSKYDGTYKIAQATFPVKYFSKTDKYGPTIDFVSPICVQSFYGRTVVSLKDRNTDIIITPDHEIVYQNNYRELRKKQFKNVSRGEMCYLPSSGHLLNTPLLSEDFSRLLAMVHADGCLTGFYLQLQFKKIRKIKRCKTLLNKLNLDYTETKTKGYSIFYVRSIKEHITAFISPTKKFCSEFIFMVDRLAFLDEARHWDGITSAYGSRDRIKITNIDKESLGVIQTLCVLSGKQSHLRYAGRTGYSNKKRWELSYRLGSHAYNNTKSIKTRKLGAKRHVYCAQVPSGNIVVRRNGKPLICGNCNFGLTFGLGARGYQKHAKKQYKVELSETEAYNSVKSWHRLYAGYSEYQDTQAETCKLELSVKTKLGKIRKLSEENYYGASANTPVQGTASECILYALCLLARELPACATLINCVHDEIVVQCKKGAEKEVSAIVSDCMTRGYKVLFPFGLTRGLVKTGVGNNWATAK